MQKKKNPKTKPIFFENQRALRELTHFKHRDLQRACIVRGLTSQEVVDKSHTSLVQWFIENYENTQDENLLINHDIWVDEQLKIRGYKVGDALLAPSLRFSYVGEIEKMDKPKIIKAIKPVVTEKKEKSTIDTQTGIRAGTKKALTYQLTIEKMHIEQIIKKVKAAFPEAEEKSIKIWNKRCIKEQK